MPSFRELLIFAFLLPGMALAAGSDAASAVRVRELIVADRWREALDEARRGAAVRPDDRDAQTALGEALYRAGLIEEAGRLLDPLVAGASPAGAASAGALPAGPPPAGTPPTGAPPNAAPPGQPPARAFATLGLVRQAQGRRDEAGDLLARALALAPQDRWVVYQAASAAPSRAEAVTRLERYLALSTGDDPDRIEGARGTIRTNRALGERRVWIPVARPDRVEIPIRALGDGAGGVTGYVVAADLGAGRKTWLLLDSGSGGLFVVERAVKKAAPEMLSEESVFAAGGSGRHDSKRAILPRFEVGGLSFKDALITTTPRDMEPTGKYLGVLGLSVFDGYLITLDLKRGRLLLEKDAAAGGGVPYWDVSGQMLVESAAGGTRGLFLFDTGAFRSVVATSFAESVPGAKLGPDAAVRTYGGSVSGARLATGLPLGFSDLPPSAAPKTAFDLTQRSRLCGVEVSGFLGLDLLAGHHIVIDMRNQTVKGRALP